MSEKVKVESKYGATLTIVAILNFFAWVGIDSGVLIAGSAATASCGFNFLLFAIGIALFVISFLALAQAQFLQTNIDVADYTREMLRLTRQSLGVDQDRNAR